MSRDGTASAKAVSAPGIGYSFIDTVGLDSKNHRSSKEQVRSLVSAKEYRIILVADHSRMTTWTDKFYELLEYLRVPRQSSVLVYLRLPSEFTSEVVKEKKDDFLKGIKQNKDSREYVVCTNVGELRSNMQNCKFAITNLPPPQPTTRAVVPSHKAEASQVPSVSKVHSQFSRVSNCFLGSLNCWRKEYALTSELASIVLPTIIKVLEIKDAESERYSALHFAGDRHISAFLADIMLYKKEFIGMSDTVPELVENRRLTSIFDLIVRVAPDSPEKTKLKAATEGLNDHAKGDIIEAAVKLMHEFSNKADCKAYDTMMKILSSSLNAT
eukprot:gene24022-29069_t